MKKLFLTLSFALIGLVSFSQDTATYTGYTYNNLTIETDSVNVHITVKAMVYGQTLTNDLYVKAANSKTVTEILAILEDKAYLFFLSKYR